MNLNEKRAQIATRRHFLQSCKIGLGSIALSTMLVRDGRSEQVEFAVNALAVRQPPLVPRAKQVIYLHMSGGPPQHDLFDYKPRLVELNDQPCPDEFLRNQRFAFIKGHPKLLGTPWKFQRCGPAGTWVSELLPHFAEITQEVSLVKSMCTDQFNHAPAELLLCTGSPRFGSASMGSWITYGLGAENQNLPGFVVLVSGARNPSGGASLWGSGFLPSVFQGVQCRTMGEPILYATNPQGMSSDVRRRNLDAIRKLNELEFQESCDPETLSRISQYELAYRMQTTVPEVMDISREPKHIHQMYGTTTGRPSFANNCLLARRLIEQGVRYVQLFDWGWDMHGAGMHEDLITGLSVKCRQTDRPVTALVQDLKQRGLLDETLVIWGGEFGRTSMNQENRGSKLLGRDHHPLCFTIWMAGGGVKQGYSWGQTDDLGYFIAEGKVTVHDLHATILHLLGLDPHRLSVPFQGLNQRLIGPTEEPKVQTQLLA